MKLGCKPSKLNGTEQIYAQKQNLKIPEAYTYEPYMSPVLNQGNEATCVPCSISAHLNWNHNITAKTNKADNGVNIKEIYSVRADKKAEGMTIKEALHYIYKHGVNSKAGLMKIRKYAMVKSDYMLKQAILMNGPCLAALKVYNFNFEFWDKNYGEYQGGHCISIIGWNKNGFIIRNSWGASWGNKGYTLIPYEDFSEILEIWTIID